MRYRSVVVGILLLAPGWGGATVSGEASGKARAGADSAHPRWVSGDMHLAAATVASHDLGAGQHLLLCRGDFSLSAADQHFQSERAVVWITAGAARAEGGAADGYEIQVYLAGRVWSRRPAGGQDAGLRETVLARGKTVVLKGRLRGEVFLTTDNQQTGSSADLPLFQEASATFAKAGFSLPAVPAALRPEPAAPGVSKSKMPEPQKGYTLGYAPLTEVPLRIERSRSEDGEEIITFIGRAYYWWQQTAEKPDQSQLYELEADSLVLWRNPAEVAPPEAEGVEGQQGGVTQVYVCGDVLFTQGIRTIRADELYYDLRNQQVLATNVVMKTFDTQRNVPIFVRAREFRQVSRDRFEAADVTLTTSEFWTPQLSLGASYVGVTDRTDQEKAGGILPRSSFDAQLKDVRFQYGGATLFGLPVVRSDRQRPDVPIRSIRVGHDSAYGTALETRWFLSRLLGLREPEGTDSWLDLDYYSKRGVGGGVEVNYQREDYFGSLLGYAIEDHGEDRLSRTRKNIDVPDDTRGRFHLMHRQYLPYRWQLTGEVSYLSDQNFLEQYYRTEFNVGKEQETLLHLKRIEDNWGLSFLGKVRINDFQSQVEELPTAEYHLTGESLFDERFTFFSDNQVSRYRYRFGTDHSVHEPDDYFWFTGTRNELDLPLTWNRLKIVPFVAGTFGYEDGANFQATLDEAAVESQDAIWIGEGGVRLSTPPFWRVYPDVESRLLDLHQLRHVITPRVEAVAFAESDVVARQRDTLDLEIAQRWQTKRGPADARRTIDWVQWNTDFVWVDESSESSPAPDRFIWNTPFIPLANRAGGLLPPLDRRTTGRFGPRQNYVSTDAVLRLTDTTSILTDGYFGMQTGTLEQFDIGFSRLCWPNLSYYVGTRYLRNVENGLGQRGSNALTFAATYVLDPRYTVVVSEQYDFEYSANIRTDLTLIRKYHRINLALTFSVDASLDEQRVVLSLWPEGIPELALGLTRYMELGASDVYY
jgi:hypothetical protein